MNHSYNDALDAPGDTQPDSQIYRDWTSGIFDGNSHEIIIQKAQSLFHPIQEEADIPTDSVEAASSSQDQHHSPTVTNPTVSDDNELRLRSNAPTSPLKFETPAMAGRKRDSQGQILSSAMRTVTTPGTVLNGAALFGNSGMGNAMSLTQVFNATQAATSPLVGAPSEDAVFQKPSPNFANARHSSPALPMSSPLKTVYSHSDLHQRSSSEPRAEYVTLKQSQDQRSRTRTIQHENTDVSLHDSWDEPTPAERRVSARKAREQLDNETGKSFAQISAPTTSSPSTRRKGRTLLSVTKTPQLLPKPTPLSSRRNAYDGPYTDDEEEETERPQSPIYHEGSEVGNGDNNRESSPDILSQDIPSAPPTVKRATGSQPNVQVPNTSSYQNHTNSGRTAGSPSASRLLRQSQSRLVGSQTTKRTSPFKGNKGSVIMDSQPDVTIDSDSMPRPRSILMPSSPSTNQYSIDQTTVRKNTGYTSQRISSSIPPLPPKSTLSELDDEDEHGSENEGRLPSSPPSWGSGK